MAQRQVVLTLYRHILGLVQSMPDAAARKTAWETARFEFRRHQSESDPTILRSLIAKAESKLSFLRMTSPRRGRSHLEGSGHFVQTADGEIVSYDAQIAAASKAFSDNRITEEQLQRHQRLLRYAESAFFPLLNATFTDEMFKATIFYGSGRTTAPRKPLWQKLQAGTHVRLATIIVSLTCMHGTLN